MGIKEAKVLQYILSVLENQEDSPEKMAALAFINDNYLNLDEAGEVEAAIGDRIREGLAKAQASGKHIGRPKKKTLTKVEREAIDMYNKGIPNVRIFKALDMPKSRFYRAVKIARELGLIIEEE